MHVYRHRDLESLEQALSRASARRKLIVTDSVFSMDGDVAPLGGICALAGRYGAMVMVDEAHATGVIGSRGAGLVEALGLAEQVTVQMGTHGKALGCFGAYVAGSTLVEYLINSPHLRLRRRCPAGRRGGRGGAGDRRARATAAQALTRSGAAAGPV